MSDMNQSTPGPSTPQTPIPPVPPGPPSTGAPAGGGWAQSPIGAPSQAPGGAPPSWQTMPGGGWSPATNPSGGGGAGVKIAVVVALVAVVAIAAGAVFALRGAGSDSSTTPAATEAASTDDDSPATDAGSSDESVAPQATDGAAETTAPPPSLTVPPPVNLFAGTQARQVVNEVAAARGADPLRILQASFYPTYAFAQVQDPSIPANVDQYEWRDRQVSAPSPVRLTGDGDLEANLFSASEVRWKAIPVLVKGALATTEIPDGEVTHVIVTRNLPFSDAVVIRVYVNSPRSSGFIEADAQGNILRVNVS